MSVIIYAKIIKFRVGILETLFIMQVSLNLILTLIFYNGVTLIALVTILLFRTNYSFKRV